MYTPNIASAIKKMSVNEHRYFIFENYYKRIGFVKERRYYSMKYLKIKDLLLLSTKLIENIPDPHNAKEYYQLFIRKKNTKPLKESEIITYLLKTFENPKIFYIK